LICATTFKVAIRKDYKGISVDTIYELQQTVNHNAQSKFHSNERWYS